MPNAYITNQKPTGYGAAMSALVVMLEGAGWVVKSSGDGLTGFSSTSKLFTGTGSGAAGWNNAKAWVRIQDPQGLRELILQHNAAGGSRIKYSASAKFAGGAASATVTPTATDEKYIRGGASDAVPTYGASWFAVGTATGTCTFQGAALTNGSFWFASANATGGTLTTGLMLDVVTSVPEDTDPCVIHIGTANAFQNSTSGLGQTTNTAATWSLANGAAVEGTWGYFDVARTQFLSCVPGLYGFSSGGLSGVLSASGWGVNVFNGKHEAMPIAWMRIQITAATTVAPGLKGWSSLARWTTVARTNFVDTLDSLKWVCVGSLWLPWDGTTTPSNA